MNKEEIIERELNTLRNTSDLYTSLIQLHLRIIRKDPELRSYLSESDRRRLLTLRIWAQKYKVETGMILSILIPFWTNFMKSRSSRVSRGLGIRVATLTGKKSEQVLQDELKKIFPNKENESVWMSSRKEAIIGVELRKVKKNDEYGPRVDPSSMEDTETGKILNLVDFQNPKQYIRYYSKWIKKEQIQRERIETEMKKYPYRENPFVE